MKRIYFCILLASLFFVEGFGQQIKASYSASAYDQPFTGHVLAYLSKENKEPKDGFVGLECFPCFSVYAENIQPGQAVTLNDDAVSFPTTLSNIERGDYYIQIVWDRNLGGRSIAQSPGNLYSQSEKISITKDTQKVFNITATQLIPEPPAFEETKYVKGLKVPSSLLPTFHGKAMTIDAAIILPEEYDKEPERKFPVLFKVSGYGGDYHRLSGDSLPGAALDSVPIITVYLDGNCALGHSVYANSDNNGPWGDALVNVMNKKRPLIIFNLTDKVDNEGFNLNNKAQQTRNK